MAEDCKLCGGLGMTFDVDEKGVRYARPCSCQLVDRGDALLRRAQIPNRYGHCELASFWTDFDGTHSSLAAARARARKFVEDYPAYTDGRGLLFTGDIGVGKTHLAVSILRELITQKGAQCLFCDYRELLKKIQNSYNPQVAATEYEILRPVFACEVLVLDELGAAKPSEWVWDTVAHILNTRYNDKRTTIITTNYLDLPPYAATGDSKRDDAFRARREESLGDRIGERMRSRLAEMCVVVEMRGEDFRQKQGRAKFGPTVAT